MGMLYKHGSDPLLAYVLIYVKHKSFQKKSPKIKETIILKLKFPG